MRFSVKSAFLLISLVTCLPLPRTFAQPCYDTDRREGISLVRQKKYGEAMNKFWSALVTCPDRPEHNDLSDLIKDAQQKWVGDLEASIKHEKQSYEAALAAKQLAVNAQLAEEKARKEAETNAQKAKEQGIRAEALRLALLSDIARQQGRKSEGVMLSWLAIQLSGSELSPFTQRKFGEAVRDSFSTVLFNSPESIDAAQYMPAGNGLLIHTTEPAWYRLNPSESGAAQLVKLAPEYTGLTSSSNGKRMVGWTKTAVARLLDVNGQPVATLEGHTGPIRTATFSPDDQFILTCSRDHTARLWDAQGRFVAALTGHSGHVYSGSFSPDGHLILTRASDGSARLWNIDGHQIAVLQEKNEFLTEAQFDYTGKAVITLSADGISRAWSLDGKLIGLIQPASGPVKTVKAIGANAIAVITGNQDLSVYTLDGKITFSIKHPSIVAGMNSHSDGSLLITWSKDYVVRLWDRDGQLLREFKGHRANIMDASLSEDKKLLLTTSKDGTARLWNREGDLLTEWTIGPDKPLPPRFIAGGHKIVSVANGRQSTLTSSLLPADVYQKMDAATLLQSPVIRQLVQTYNIQFYESFLGH